jgi:hypothetical protein
VVAASPPSLTTDQNRRSGCLEVIGGGMLSQWPEAIC